MGFSLICYPPKLNLITLLNFDSFVSSNSTGRRYEDRSEFYVGLWSRVEIPRWIVTPGQNCTLNCDSNPMSQFNVKSWLGPQFSVKLWPGIILQRGIKTRGHNSMWKHDPGLKFQHRILAWVTIQRGIVTRGHITTLNYYNSQVILLGVSRWYHFFSYVISL